MVNGAATPTVSGWRTAELLGRGAVASVLRVEGPDGRTYAAKIAHASMADDPDAAARFLQEARLLSRLEHPSIVRVHDALQLQGRPALLMELVSGPTLEEVIARDAPLAEVRLVRIARGIAAGLEHAHAAGVVHRDLKPSNVLLADGVTPKIADFGMARATSLAGADPQALTVVGTPDYMAPESIDPLAVDARSDLYALGCVLFEMITGRTPYQAATPFGIVQQHRDAPIPALPAGFGEPLHRLVTQLLAKSPADRPQSASAVIAALDGLDAASPVALALPESSGQARCAHCQGVLLPDLAVCLGCGAPVATVEPGELSLLIVGPGAVGDKLDSALRGRLHAWLGGCRALGLRPSTALSRRIPRLPFTLVTAVSEQSASAIGRSLEGLGLQWTIVQGNPLRVKAMRSKVKGLAGRGLAIALTSMAGIWSHWWSLPVMLVAMVGIVAGVTVTSVRSTARRDDRGRKALPSSVRRALERVQKMLPAVEEMRHREGLRAVLARATALARTVPEDDPESLGEELGQAVLLAGVASARLDDLDRRLMTLERGESSDEARQLLHERDTWASRLLGLTASLEALQVRNAAAQQRLSSAVEIEALEDLRRRVEALEEVQGQ